MISAAVADRMRAEGFEVALAFDGPGAVQTAATWRPHVLVLDVMLPGFDGHEVCRRVQAERPVPVLMLTARDDETDLLVGLGVGADDYLTKPFSMRELVARVRVLLRRVERAAEMVREQPADLAVGDLHIDRAGRRVRIARSEVHLDPDGVRPAHLPRPSARHGARPRPAAARRLGLVRPRCGAGRYPHRRQPRAQPSREDRG